MQQLRLDELLGADRSPLPDPCTLADALAKVVELGPPNVAPGGDLDPLDLG